MSCIGNTIAYEFGVSCLADSPTFRSPDASFLPPCLGSATHSFDQNQRFISLDFRTNSTGLSATAPASGNVAPPGHYLLFLVSDDGVPSVGRVVRIR